MHFATTLYNRFRNNLAGILARLFSSGFTYNGLEAIARPGTQNALREIKQPKALELNGTNQEINLGNTVGNYSNNFSFFTWIKVGTGAKEQVIFSRGLLYRLFLNASNQLCFNNSTPTTFTSALSITVGSWHYVGFKMESGAITLYLDGTSEEVATSQILSLSTTNVFLGSAGTSLYFDGCIAYPSLFNTAISDTDFDNLRLQKSINTLPRNSYNFEEEAGSIAIDSGTANQNSTIVNYNSAMRVDADFTKMKSQANEVGFTISDGSTYYYNDDDTGLIASGVIIPKLAGQNKCAAYLAGGAQADLQFSGRVPYNFTIDNGIYFQSNGTNRTITIGNTGINATSVSVWVKQSVDNQVLFALQSSTATAVSVAAGVLTFGASLSASNIKIDEVSKTASEAGALLNDNAWHKLEFDLTSIAANNLILFGDGTNFGNIGMSDFKINDTDVQVPLNDKPLSSVVTKIDGVESYKAVTNSDTAQWQNDTTGQLPVRNLLQGYSLYEHATEPDTFIPYFDGVPYAGTPPTGYTKTSDHPSINGFNGCEAEFKATRIYDLWKADSGNFLYDGSNNPQNVSYADFVAQAGDVNDLGNIIYNINEINRTVTNLKFKELANPTMTIEVDATSDLTQEIRLNDTAFIDWGDGSPLEQAGGINVSVPHTYAVAGNYTLKIYGTFTDFRSIDNAFDFELSDLPSSLTFFICEGNNTTSGNIADLPSSLIYFRCSGFNTTSGNIADLPSSLIYFRCSGFNTTSGNIADLPSSLTFFICNGSSSLSFSGTWDCSDVYEYFLYQNGLTTTEVDNLLISMAADITSSSGGRQIVLAGSNGARTSASDAAVTYLQGLGFTVTTN